MKKHIYVANWKMFLSYTQTERWLSENQTQIATLASTNEVVLCPSAESLAYTAKIAQQYNIKIGAQECSAHENGAFTGQISAKSLKEIGCTFCIVGHSEQRSIQKNYDILGRITQLMHNNITPIVCISQTTAEYIDPIKHALEKFPHKQICIAYEPLESIGTGIAATLDSITQVISDIKKQLPAKISYEILYGGSVTPENVKSLKTIDALDGFLIGSASTDGNRFAAIITA